ncbi:drug resistance transporter EmrB/QacA subfamily [Tricladium varicosporioides]|nr:drug resistance transporter EmrB/QacA subfamily [Hymenoscyphus varicosporioides]
MPSKQLQESSIAKDELNLAEPAGSEQPPKEYLRGWRLHVLTVGVWVALFLSTLETTIVSTSLVSITNALGGFEIRDWVVTSYLITYTGFLVIYAKLGDIFGAKTMFLLAIIIFTVFSIVCGATNDIVELTIFRAFQGMGASGIYSMIVGIAPTMVPPQEFGKYIAIISTVFLLASVLGPVLGGVINTHTTWRWVFLLNAPGGGIALVLVTLFLPSPAPSKGKELRQYVSNKLSKESFARVDLLGTFLLLSFSVLIVFSLEMAGTRYAWGSPIIISTMVVAGVSGVGFVVWEWIIERSKTTRQEPTIPLSLFKDRMFTGMMVTAFFTGFAFVAIVVNIPQRAQAVYGLSPTKAGLGLLPLLLTSPLFTAISGALTSNYKVPPLYLILIGEAFQIIGVGLTCGLPKTAGTSIPKEQYGYEVLMGAGFGIGLSTLLQLGKLVVDEKHLPVTMGALTQVRVLGGTISLAICSTILNNHLKPSITALITPAEAKAIAENLSAINRLTAAQQVSIRTAFAEGYNLQNIFLTAMTGLGVLTSLLLIEKRPRIVVAT